MGETRIGKQSWLGINQTFGKSVQLTPAQIQEQENDINSRIAFELVDAILGGHGRSEGT
jgi:flagellar motor switch protein FliM